jgi:hypothetical protein
VGGAVQPAWDGLLASRGPRCSSRLADLYVKQGKKSEAEATYKRSLATREKLLGPRHPLVVKDLADYPSLLHSMDRNEEARKLDERVKEARPDQAPAR